MKPIYQWGFQLKHIEGDDATVMNQIYIAAKFCGTLGLDGNRINKDHIDRIKIDYHGKFCINLSPFHLTKTGDYMSEVFAYMERLKVISDNIPKGRIDIFILDCENMGTSDLDDYTLGIFYSLIYNVTKVNFPNIPIIWYRSLDWTALRLYLAPRDGETYQLYNLYNPYQVIDKTQEMCHAAGDPVNNPLYAWVGWFNKYYKDDTPWETITPALAGAAGGLLAQTMHSLSRVNGVILYPGLHYDKIPNWYECWEAFAKGYNGRDVK